MIMGLMVKDTFKEFSNVASPYLNIKDVEHYQETLDLIESLMEEAEDTLDNKLNPVIDLLAHAIEEYENKDEELNRFEEEVESIPDDISILRLLMEQHNLGVNDLPEIGSKSMVSRVLSGDRDLSKKHISNLSHRFDINPGVFFK